MFVKNVVVPSPHLGAGKWSIRYKEHAYINKVYEGAGVVLVSGTVGSARASDGCFKDGEDTGALRSTASSSSRILEELLFPMSSSFVYPLPAHEPRNQNSCIRGSNAGQDILKPTFIIGFQSSSGFFSLRSTRMSMEGLLNAIRGRSSFAKCLHETNC